MTTKQRPISKLQDRDLTASVWRNESQDGRFFYTVTLERVYTDKNGGLKNTDRLDARNDLLRAARLLQNAYDEFLQLRQQDKSPSNGDSS